jgi:ABC-type nickel/cobalt efflux system permease component RcnA
MAVLGFLIIVVVVVAAVAALLRGGASVRIDLEWFTVRTDASVVFLAGVAATLLFFLGVWLMVGGAKRSRRRRLEIKALKKRAEASEKARREEEARAATIAETRSGGTHASTIPDEHSESTPPET